jgi:hypothetical protein
LISQEVFMKKLFLLSLLASLSAFACDRSENREAREEVGEAGREAREETREAGEAVEREAESAAGRVPDASQTKEHEELTGTVTRFSAGKTLAIQTTDGDTRTFDLDEKGTKVTMSQNIKEGARVQVTVHRSGDQTTINVAPQS